MRCPRPLPRDPQTSFFFCIPLKCMLRAGAVCNRALHQKSEPRFNIIRLHGHCATAVKATVSETRNSHGHNWLNQAVCHAGLEIGRNGRALDPRPFVTAFLCAMGSGQILSRILRCIFLQALLIAILLRFLNCAGCPLNLKSSNCPCFPEPTHYTTVL